MIMRSWSVIFILVVLMLVQGFDFNRTAESTSKDKNNEKVNAPSGEGVVYSYGGRNTPKKADKVVNEIVRLKHIEAEKALNIICKISPKIIAVSKDSDVLVIRGESGDVREAIRVIEDVDNESSQIMIECKVVEVSESALESSGISWGKEQGSFKFSVDGSSGKVSLSDDFVVTLNALVARGEANVLAHPKITTLDGKQAEINIGSRIPYAVPANSSGTSTQWTVRYIDAGVSLKISSIIRSDGIIISNIKPEVSSVSEWRSTAAGEFPVISTRNADVTVKIRNGETLAIGGLISKSERENISKIPILADAPVFGELFKRRIKEEARTEVIFLITPTIIK